MKNILIMSLCVVGCSTSAQPTEKPTGESVLASLFAASDIQLSKEPMCDMASMSMNKPNLQLKDHLSTILSSSFESKNKTAITTSCIDSKHELDKENIIDVWDCTFLVNETNPEGDFISSSTVAFSLNKKDLHFVPSSLRCF